MVRLPKFLLGSKSRIAYDAAVTLSVSLFVLGFDWAFLGHTVGPAILVSPLLVLLLNSALGVYTRFRIGSGRVKTPILTVSVVASAALLFLVAPSVPAVVLWAVLLWAPLVLPRIFLNFNTRVKSSFISAAVRGKGPVLVVGGAGYIGSHVVDQLLRAGFPVRLLDTFIYGKDSIQEFLGNSRFEAIEGEVTDIMKLTEAMSGVSAVVHLAGLVGDPACAVDESFTRHTNVIATRMLKEIAISLGVPRFVFASSCSVYGANEREVDELSELNPVSLYAHTKIDSEKELLSLIDESFSVTILRFATVFGHSRRPRFDLVANLFTAQAYNEGRITLSGADQWRPFIHVSDLARAVVMVIQADPDLVGGQTFNVGDSRLNMTIGQLAEQVQAIVSEERPVEVVSQAIEGDRRNYFVSFRKIHRVLGYQASVLVADGVREMLAEFKKGSYHHYRDAIYSNLEMTRRALADFRDPAHSARLYGPIADEFHQARVANE
ncbi:MAG: NAD-dependent epimerase/dehydratase family protein [Bdellovibrionota bacterium]